MVDYYLSPLGLIRLQCDEDALTEVRFLDEMPKLPLQKDNSPLLELGKSWLDSYFDGFEPNPEILPLAPASSPYQQAARECLLGVSYGRTISYRDLAGRIAKKLEQAPANQAAGQAMHKNPLSLIVPCHRVIGSNGTLVGYGGGLHRKEWLLNFESLVQATHCVSF